MATATQVKAFIQELGTLAVAESNRRIAEGKGFVLPSVCIAQSAIESGWGTAPIMVKANAYFGIKAGSSWTGKVFNSNTQEVTTSGEYYNAVATFRAYDSKADSVRDYYDLIGNLSRYSKGLSYGSDSSQWLTARQCITAIWSGGYTPEQTYVEKIMSTINARNLTDFDKMITGVATDMPVAVEYTFTKEDMIQGAPVISDSGRSLAIDSENKTNVSLKLEKMVTIENDITLYVDIPGEDLMVSVARLTGDTPTFGTSYATPQTYSFVKDQQFMFHIHKKDYSELLLDDLPDSLTIRFHSGVPDGTESYSSAIAFFVKIE